MGDNSPCSIARLEKGAGVKAAAPPQAAPVSLRPWHGAALLLVLCIALATRIHQLGSDSLWLDECLGLQVTAGHDVSWPSPLWRFHPKDETLSLASAGPWWRVWATRIPDYPNPPLYNQCLRLWRMAFGSAEAAVRSLSVVCSLLAILALFDAVRHLNGPVAALWACLLMALAPPQVMFAQEARSYALLLATGMAALAAVARLQVRGASAARAMALGAAVLAMELTHYFAAGAIAALLLYAIVQLRGRARRMALVALVAAILIGLTLWARPLAQQLPAARSDASTWLHDPSRPFAPAFWNRLLLLPSRFLADPAWPVQDWAKWLAVLYVLPVLAWRRRQRVWLWWFWLVGTVAPVALLDFLHQTKGVAFIRYTLLASPAVYAMLACTGDWIWSGRWAPWAGSITAALAALLCGTALMNGQAYHPPWRADWRQMANVINARRQSGEAVCCVGSGNFLDWSWPPQYIWLPLGHYLRSPPAAVVFFLDQRNTPVTPADLQQTLAPFPGIWAVVANQDGSGEWPPREWRVDFTQDFPAAGALQHLTPARAMPPVP